MTARYVHCLLLVLCVVHCQTLIKSLGQSTRVVLVNEFLTTKKCSYCCKEGNDPKKDYLDINPITREAHCRDCGRRTDRDDNGGR